MYGPSMSNLPIDPGCVVRCENTAYKSTVEMLLLLDSGGMLFGVDKGRKMHRFVKRANKIQVLNGYFPEGDREAYFTDQTTYKKKEERMTLEELLRHELTTGRIGKTNKSHSPATIKVINNGKGKDNDMISIIVYSDEGGLKTAKRWRVCWDPTEPKRVYIVVSSDDDFGGKVSLAKTKISASNQFTNRELATFITKHNIDHRCKLIKDTDNGVYYLELTSKKEG